MEVATALVASGTPLARELGTVIVFLPQRWSTPAARLLARAWPNTTELEIIVGVTGAEAADAQVVASLRRIGIEPGHDLAAGIAPALGTEVWNASDPDDEVRAIVRGVVDAIRAGVPLERMAVLYASDEPYARLLHEHFVARRHRAQRSHDAIDVGLRPRSWIGSHPGPGRHRVRPGRRVRPVRVGAGARRARPSRPGRAVGARVARCGRGAGDRRMAHPARRVRGDVR